MQAWSPSQKLLDNVKWFFQTIVLAAIVLAVAQFLVTEVFANKVVDGPSMEPNFMDGDRIFASRHGKIKAGEVIIFIPPDDSSVEYIKRVIGMPGDTVKMVDDQLYVNGKKVAEPYLKEYKKENAGETFTNDFSLKGLFNVSKVPAGQYFVLGDNRPVSHDGRAFGFVSADSIVGVVKWRYWPLNKLGFF